MKYASLNLYVIQVSIDILLMKLGFIGLIQKMLNNKVGVHIAGSVLNLKVIYHRHNQFWVVQGNAPLLSALEANWRPCLLPFYIINSSVMSDMQGVAKVEYLALRRNGSGQNCRELVYWVQGERAGNKISKPGLMKSRATASVFLSFSTGTITMLQKW